MKESGMTVDHKGGEWTHPLRQLFPELTMGLCSPILSVVPTHHWWNEYVLRGAHGATLVIVSWCVRKIYRFQSNALTHLFPHFPWELSDFPGPIDSVLLLLDFACGCSQLSHVLGFSSCPIYCGLKFCHFQEFKTPENWTEDVVLWQGIASDMANCYFNLPLPKWSSKLCQRGYCVQRQSIPLVLLMCSLTNTLRGESGARQIAQWQDNWLACGQPRTDEDSIPSIPSCSLSLPRAIFEY